MRKLGFSSRSINDREGEHARVGNVFVVHDKEFWIHAPLYKPRQVVVVKNDFNNKRMLIVPVKKYKNIKLLNFDGQREINLNKCKFISYRRIYKRNNFNNTGNSYLTKKEKIALYKKRPTQVLVG